MVALCLASSVAALQWPSHDEAVQGPGVAAVRARLPRDLSAPLPELVGDGSGAPSAVAQWLVAQGVTLPLGQPLHATTAVTPGGLVGTNFPICSYPDAVSDSESLDTSSAAHDPVHGEYLVVWQAFDRVTLTNIYAQRVGWNGSLVGPVIAISEAPGVQVAASVAYDPRTGVYWVAWTDFRDGTGDVRFRRIFWDGTLLGAELVVNTGEADAFAARLACGANACALVWASDPHDGNTHILLRAYDQLTLSPFSFVLLSEATGHVTEPDICYNGDDHRFMVVWQQANPGSQWDVWSFHLTWDIWAYGPDARKAISTAIYHQMRPRVAYGHGAGRYLVVWEDSRSNVSWDVYGQRLDRGGALSGGAMGIFTGGFADLSPVAAGHGGGASEFVVAFQRDISGATQNQIYACRVTGAGGIGGAFVVREWYNARTRPSVVHRGGSDDYLVTFTDDPCATQPDIDARVARSSGQLAGGLIVISRGRKGQEAPAVAHNALRNEYLAAWADYRFLDDYDLFYRRISPAGEALPPEFILGSASALYGDPAIVHNTVSDGYLVVWQEVTSPSSGYEIYARRLSGALEPLGAAFLVSRDTATINEGVPRAVFNPGSGEYFVTWHAFTGGMWRIWGQRVSSAGNLVGGNLQISDGAGIAQSPRVALNRASNQYLVVWQDHRNGRFDVFAQKVGWAGGLLGGNYAISTATGDKNKCDLAYSLAHNEFLVVWGDTRSGGYDVWAQRLDGAGALLGGPFPVADAAVGESSPVVGYDHASHEFLVAYWVLNQSTDYDIWARRVPCNAPPSVPAFPLSGAMEMQSRCALAHNDNTTEFLIVWQDFRNGSYDIYGQRWMKLPRSRVHRGLR